ncbi:MAG: hypothetical protein PHT60_03605 [Acidiphilium sp.]|nr:hypothetical protein [Acidiphilium sp.]MDD4934843.1 hypothetical protein [Acidiphilium sp.]
MKVILAVKKISRGQSPIVRRAAWVCGTTTIAPQALDTGMDQVDLPGAIQSIEAGKGGFRGAGFGIVMRRRFAGASCHETADSPEPGALGRSEWFDFVG